MSEESYLLEPKNKKHKSPFQLLIGLMKVCFFLCAFILVILTVLANMGGSNETLHEGVRGFMSELVGKRPVSLGKLNYMGFFPTVRLDAEDIGVYAKAEDDVALMHLGKIRLSMPFLDVATKTPRITEFYVEDLNAIKGVLMPHEFSLEKMFIDYDQEGAEATLRANGKIGLQTWSFEADLEVHTGINRTSYILAPQARFAFDLADFHIKGVYDHASSSHFKIKDFEIHSGDKVINGDISISALSDNMMKLKGMLSLQNGQSILEPDFIIDLSHKDGVPTKISGEIKAEKLALADVLGPQSVFSILTRLRKLMGYDGIVHRIDGPSAFLGTHDLDLHVFLRNVNAGNAVYDALSFDLLQKSGKVHFSSVMGKDGHQLMPTIMMLDDTENQRIITIMQDGVIDIPFVQPWFKNLPAILSGKQNIRSRCGITVLSENEEAGGYNIEALALDTKEGMITIAQRSLAKGQTPFDWTFVVSNDISLQKTNLSKDFHDFVKGSLDAAEENSPCAPYILLQQPSESE